jgi:microcystin-dependent protein
MNTGYLLTDGTDISTLFANRSSGSPSGCIVPYLGVRDTDGWVLCDGIERNNNTDGKYNVLFSLQIGTGGNAFTNYTPPNLQNVFLRGGLSTSDIKLTSGTNTVQLTTDNIPSHNHSGTTESVDLSHTHDVESTENPYFLVQDNNNGICKGYDRYDNSYNGNFTSKDMSKNAIHGHTFTTSYVGSNASFDIIPVHYKVNYLLKL